MQHKVFVCNIPLKLFREQFPQYAHVAVIPVRTCDSQGGLEAGYALALMATIKKGTAAREDIYICY